MKTLSLINLVRDHLKHLALASALAVGLGAGSVQALTTTIDLGAFESGGTAFSDNALVSRIPLGTLPAGSILRKVTMNYRLEAGEPYIGDLCVLFADAAGDNGVLLVKGNPNEGYPKGASTEVSWASGDAYNVGATASQTLTAADGIPAIDLNTTEVWLETGSYSGSWAGSITLEYDAFEPAAITSFGPGATIGALSGNAASIAWTVPSGTNVAALAPTFTLSSGTCDRDNGGPTTYNFSGPVVYTVTDGATINYYTVTVTVATAVLWNVVGDGVWDESALNWLTQPVPSPTAYANGNEVIFDNTGGGTITANPNITPFSTTVSSGTYTFTGSPIAGGSLINSGTLSLKTTPSNFSSTTINGSLSYVADPGQAGFGFGQVSLNNVTINSGGVLLSKRMTATGNLTLNGGSYREASGWGETWNGSTYLAANSYVNANGNGSLHLNGPISGPGGLTTDAVGNPAYAGVYLSGANSYTGATIVNSGGLWCNNSSALGNGGALTIASGAVAILNYTGSHNVSALTLGGVAQVNPGTYGSLTSDATFKSSYFTGTGTVTTGNPASAALVTSFGTNVAGSVAVINPPVSGAAAISWLVPDGTDLATIAPDFTLSPGATCSDQTSGVVPSPNFSAGPVVYTVVSQNTLNTVTYTVTAATLPNDTSVTWNIAGGGNWNLTSSNWIGQPSNTSRPYFDGANVIFNNTAGGTITIDPNMSPLSTTVSAASGTYTFSGGPIATGSLIKDGGGTLENNGWNSYSGGTTIENGTLKVNWPGDSNPKTSMGSGPVTLNGSATLWLNRTELANALTVNGGTLVSENGFGNNYSGTITLNATLTCNMQWPMNCSGNISGAGGLTIGGSNNNGRLNLSGISSYAGPTTVTGSTLQCNSPAAVGGGDLSITGGKVNLNYTGTKNIASLTLGGVAKTTPGTYGSVASGANFQDDNYFTPGSTGTVTIGGGSDYDAWLGEFTFAVGADTTPTGDPDGDGMNNQEEYVFGLNPTLGSSVNPIVSPLNPATGNFQYTRRATPAATGTTYTVLTSTNLQDWAAGNANETGFTTGGNIQTVTVNVTAPPVDGKLFVRVKAEPSPP